MEKQITWLDYLTAFGAVTTPLLVLILTQIGLRIRTRLERQSVLEDKLRDDRIPTYNEILKPFVILLTPDAAWQIDPKNEGKDKNQVAMQLLLSVEYREQGFRLSFVGSDPVVRAYNKFNAVFLSREKIPSFA